MRHAFRMVLEGLPRSGISVPSPRDGTLMTVFSAFPEWDVVFFIGDHFGKTPGLQGVRS